VLVFKRLSFLLMFVALISTCFPILKKNSKFFYTTVRVSPPLRVSPGAVRTSRIPLGTPLVSKSHSVSVSNP